MSDTRIVLIRHGESRATVERFVGGPRSCTGLTQRGREQAEALRDRLMNGYDIAPTAVYSSHFPRALETAQILSPALGSLSSQVVAGWGEHDPGPECDGMSYVDFVAQHSQIDWDGDPNGVIFPGGETVAQFQKRVMETLRQTVRDNESGTVAVVCHGGVIDAVMRIVLHGPATGKFELHTQNTSLTEVVHVSGSKWKLVRYNDVAHLLGSSLLT